MPLPTHVCPLVVLIGWLPACTDRVRVDELEAGESGSEASTGAPDVGDDAEPGSDDTSTGEPDASSTSAVPACGDGVLDDGEACDDGNADDADGCEADCTLPACDNGIIDPGELCLQSEPRIHAIPPLALDMQLADVDGDGHTDAVVMFLDLVNDFHDIQVYRGDGDGGFSLGTTIAGDVAQRAFLVADVHGDGAVDVVVAGGDPHCFGQPCEPMPGSLRLHPGLGDGSFGPPIELSATPAPARPHAADVDGDGVLDLVVPERGPGTDPGVSVYPGHPADLDFDSPVFSATAFHVQHLAVLDVDGDEVLDLLGATSTMTEGIVASGAGDGTFTELERFPAGPGPGGIGVLSSDADGLALVLPFPDGSSATVVERVGGRWRERGDVAVHGNPIAVTVADMTHDGLADFVVPNRQPNLTTVRVGGVDSGFLEPEPYQPGARPVATGVADMNEDGAVDLVVATVYEGRLSVFLAAP